MKNAIRMAVFDMAGTTIDENNVVYKTVQSAINAAGFDLTLERYWRRAPEKKNFKP